MGKRFPNNGVLPTSTRRHEFDTRYFENRQRSCQPCRLREGAGGRGRRRVVRERFPVDEGMREEGVGVV